MKKQAAFYLGWNGILILLLRLYDFIDTWTPNYLKQNHPIGGTIPQAFLPHVLMKIGILVTIGMLITLLIYTGFQFKHSSKSAILELILIGIPALCLATLPMVSYFFYTGRFQYLQHLAYLPMWLYRHIPSQSYATIGSILLGYELVIFIIRMTQCTKTEVPSVSE